MDQRDMQWRVITNEQGHEEVVQLNSIAGIKKLPIEGSEEFKLRIRLNSGVKMYCPFESTNEALYTELVSLATNQVEGEIAGSAPTGNREPAGAH